MIWMKFSTKRIFREKIDSRMQNSIDPNLLKKRDNCCVRS
jgi:hypothetical protein